MLALGYTRLLVVGANHHTSSSVLRHMAKAQDPQLPEAERLIARLFSIQIVRNNLNEPTGEEEV